VTTNRSTAHPGRGGTVGGSENCAADTEVSKNSDVGRNEMTVGLLSESRGGSHVQ